MEVVLDTSVVLKWFLPEEKNYEAQTLRAAHINGDILICAPHLLIFEVVNALVYKKEITAKEIEQIIDILFYTNLSFLDFGKELTSQTSRLSRKYKISVYDASYVALTKGLSCQFITADKKLYNRIKKLSVVRLLE